MHWPQLKRSFSNQNICIEPINIILEKTLRYPDEICIFNKVALVIILLLVIIGQKRRRA